MKRIALYIISAPFAVVGFLYDLIKFPVLIFFLMPISTLIWLIELLDENEEPLSPIELFCDVSVLGYRMWKDLVSEEKQ